MLGFKILSLAIRGKRYIEIVLEYVAEKNIWISERIDQRIKKKICEIPELLGNARRYFSVSIFTHSFISLSFDSSIASSKSSSPHSAI